MSEVRVEAISPSGTKVSFWVRNDCEKSLSDLDISIRDRLVEDLKVSEEEANEFELHILDDQRHCLLVLTYNNIRRAYLGTTMEEAKERFLKKVNSGRMEGGPQVLMEEFRPSIQTVHFTSEFQIGTTWVEGD
jgi:hypothetical protein